MMQRGRSEETLLQFTLSYVPSNENGDCVTMKVLLNWFACYKQSDWPKNVNNPNL